MADDFESRVRETGLRLYELIEGETPSVFKKEYWMGKIMERCMKDDAFKVEMFRFVDVFPCLHRQESVAKHLKEYFCRPEQDFPATLQWGLRQVSPKSMAAQMAAKGIAGNIEITGKQFIAGSTPQEALPVLEGLRSQGMAFTADLLGEAVISEAEAEKYQGRYALSRLQDKQPCNGCIGYNFAGPPPQGCRGIHARLLQHSLLRTAYNWYISHQFVLFS